VTRHRPGNLYHHLADVYNAWLLARFFGRSAATSSVLLVDDHQAPGPQRQSLAARQGWHGRALLRQIAERNGLDMELYRLVQGDLVQAGRALAWRLFSFSAPPSGTAWATLP